MLNREFCSIGVWALAVAFVAGCGGGGESTTNGPSTGLSFNQRMAEIEAVSDPLLKARQLREFAKNQYKAKNLSGADDVFREALSTCEKIESPSDRAVELAFLSGAMVDTSDTSGAKKAINAAVASLGKIKDPANKIDAMSVVAKAYSAMGNKTAAVSLLREAAKLVDSIKADGNQELAREEKSGSLLAIASAYKFLQRLDDMRQAIDQSLETAKSIEDPRGRCDAIAIVAQGLKRMRLDGGDAAFDLAIENARQIPEPLSQGHALAEIGMKLNEIHEGAKAAKILDEAEKVAEKITDMGLREELQAKIRKARG